MNLDISSIKMLTDTSTLTLTLRSYSTFSQTTFNKLVNSVSMRRISSQQSRI